MKTLIYLFAIAMLLFAGCAKDEMLDETPDLKKAKVPIPMKADFCAIPDMTVMPLSVNTPGGVLTLPGGMYVTGTCSHMGIVDSEKSYSKVEALTFVMEDGKPFLLETGTGIMTAANGDNYKINWWVKTSLPSWEYIGEVEMFDGTGKFEGCSGTVDMVGTVDPVNHTNCWTGTGWMEFESDK
jgi:hypothetical protein